MPRGPFLLLAACAAPALAQAPAAVAAPPAAAADVVLSPNDPIPAVPPPADPLDPLPSITGGDPLLTEPLPPLATFDATPPPAVQLQAAEAEARVRYDVAIEGLDAVDLTEDFELVSELWRGRGDPATAGQIGSRLRADQRTAVTLLESEGYYAGRADGGIATEEGQRTRATLTVDPGPRYAFRTVTLDAIPEGREDLRAVFPLKPGDPIRAADVIAAEAGYKLRLANIGFPFADLGPSDVELDDATNTGDYLLTGTAGPLARIGAIRLDGYAPFDLEHAQVIARFRPGDRYSAVLVDDFRRALIATQLFSGLTLRPVDTGVRLPDGSAVTDVVVGGSRGPVKLLAGQLGYETRVGLRAEVQWRHRNLIRPEGAFTARAVAGTQEQLLGAELRLSNWRQRDRTLAAVAEISNENRPAFQARSLTLSGRLSYDSTPIWQKRWTYSGGAELIGTDVRDRATETGVLGPRRQFLIAALPLQLGFDATEDLLNPTSGFRLLGRVSPEAALQGGQFRFYARLLAEGSAYRAFGGDGQYVVAGRLRVGSIPGIERVDLAPTRRFYAGGGGSVRGYDFQDIGPKDPENRPLGGRSINEAAVELRYRFGDFGVVGFVDAGQVYEGVTPRFSDLRFGAGVGARYYTSFGPLRFDVARGLNRRAGDPAVALYISIGQAF